MVPTLDERPMTAAGRALWSHPMAAAPTVRVLIADDHDAYRNGILRALELHPAIDVVAACSSGSEALDVVREQAPDVALVDCRMPGTDGYAVLASVVAERLPTRVLLLTGASTPDLADRAIGAGAGGMVSKMADRDVIADAVLAVAEGRVVTDFT
jgi:two-component system, NarL family, nitrate/nitrite response regulator NarL